MDDKLQELDALQRTLNHSIDTFRCELVAAGLPPLSLQATEPHPLDDANYLPPPKLYEARRLAIGMHLTPASLDPISDLVTRSEHCLYYFYLAGSLSYVLTANRYRSSSRVSCNSLSRRLPKKLTPFTTAHASMS